MERDKHVDESWKDSVDQEKSKIIGAPDDALNQPIENDESVSADGRELNFFNYIASLGFQALIFMGEVPNPITNQVEKNVKQAIKDVILPKISDPAEKIKIQTIIDNV